MHKKLQTYILKLRNMSGKLNHQQKLFKEKHLREIIVRMCFKKLVSFSGNMLPVMETKLMFPDLAMYMYLTDGWNFHFTHDKYMYLKIFVMEQLFNHEF